MEKLSSPITLFEVLKSWLGEYCPTCQRGGHDESSVVEALSSFQTQHKSTTFTPQISTSSSSSSSFPTQTKRKRIEPSFTCAVPTRTVIAQSSSSSVQFKQPPAPRLQSTKKTVSPPASPPYRPSSPVSPPYRPSSPVVVATRQNPKGSNVMVVKKKATKTTTQAAQTKPKIQITTKLVTKKSVLPPPIRVPAIKESPLLKAFMAKRQVLPTKAMLQRAEEERNNAHKEEDEREEQEEEEEEEEEDDDDDDDENGMAPAFDEE